MWPFSKNTVEQQEDEGISVQPETLEAFVQVMDEDPPNPSDEAATLAYQARLAAVEAQMRKDDPEGFEKLDNNAGRSEDWLPQPAPGTTTVYNPGGRVRSQKRRSVLPGW